jgi:hydrogenase nickel incorporation protein HypB
MQSELFPTPFIVNEQVAAANRRNLRRNGVAAINLVGPPGVGKSTLIGATVRRLIGTPVRTAAIVAHVATSSRHPSFVGCEQVAHLVTPALDAQDVHRALEQMRLGEIDLLFIESDGDPRFPAGFNVGEDALVGVFSAAGGDDKAAEFPNLITGSSLVLLTKADLEPYVPFDRETFQADVRQLNPIVDLIELSIVSGDGMTDWLRWLGQRLAAARPPMAEMEADPDRLSTEWWFG